jgi:hypothetical protein
VRSVPPHARRAPPLAVHTGRACTHRPTHTSAIGISRRAGRTWAARYSARHCSSTCGSSGTVSVAQICPCGCGLLQPINAPVNASEPTSERRDARNQPTFVLKYLNVGDVIQCTEFAVLIRPDINHSPNAGLAKKAAMSATQQNFDSEFDVQHPSRQG